MQNHFSFTPNFFIYLHNFLPLNNMGLFMLYLRDSEICDPCLHFFFLLFLRFLRLVLGVADWLIDMLIQELKELVDVPATVEFHNYGETFPSCNFPQIVIQGTKTTETSYKMKDE